MDLQTLIVLIIELIGTIAFSISGAMVGIRRKMDIFGVLVLGVVTAVGGGMMRDVILGKTPSAFVKPIYVEVAVISALAPFLLLSINKRLLHSKYQALYAGLMFLMDSVGLGIFTAVGVSTGWTAGYHDNMFFLSFLGVLTGVGGGDGRSSTIYFCKACVCLCIDCGGNLLCAGVQKLGANSGTCDRNSGCACDSYRSGALQMEFAVREAGG